MDEIMLDGLLTALSEADAERRRVVAQTLAALGPRAGAVLPQVVEASITDPAPTVRYSLLSALERMEWSAAEAVPTFVRLLEHHDEVAQARAAWAIGRVGPEAAAGVPGLVAVACDVGRIVDPRWSAVGALKRMGTAARECVPAVTRLLRDADPDMREAAARALGAIADDAETVQALIGALADADQLVRESAADGLAAIGAPAADAAIPPLEGLLLDHWPTVRAAAAGALRALGAPAVAVATPAVPDSHRQAVDARLERLLERLASSDERTRQISTFEIGKLGPEAGRAVPLLIDLYGTALNLDVRYSAAFAFGKMGAVALTAVPALLRGLSHDPDPDVRSTTAWALGRLGPLDETWRPAILDALAAALADEDSLVREESCRALAAQGPAAHGARPGLARCAADGHPLVRLRAREALLAIESG